MSEYLACLITAVVCICVLWPGSSSGNTLEWLLCCCRPSSHGVPDSLSRLCPCPDHVGLWVHVHLFIYPYFSCDTLVLFPVCLLWEREGCYKDRMWIVTLMVHVLLYNVFLSCEHVTEHWRICLCSVQLPHIFKLLKSRCSQGVNIVRVALELQAVSSNVAYCIYHNFPLRWAVKSSAVLSPLNSGLKVYT